MSTGKIIEALEEERLNGHKPVQDLKKYVRALQPPDFHIAIGMFNDDYKTIEVSVHDIGTGKEICRHVFENLGVFNAFLGWAFAPPDDIVEGAGRRPDKPFIIEHRIG